MTPTQSILRIYLFHIECFSFCLFEPPKKVGIIVQYRRGDLSRFGHRKRRLSSGRTRSTIEYMEATDGPSQMILPLRA